MEDKKEIQYTIGSGISNWSLVADCERVISIGKGVGNLVDIDLDRIANLDSIEINGHKFKKV